MNGSYESDLTVWVKKRRKLAQQADQLCSQLNRMEDFDEEQRAEMYTILQAIRRGGDDLEFLLGDIQRDCVDA